MRWLTSYVLGRLEEIVPFNVPDFGGEYPTIVPVLFISIYLYLLLFITSAEAPKDLMPIDLGFKTRKVELMEIEMPTFEKKPRFTFPLRDRFIQEKDTMRLIVSVDTETIPAPTV